MAKNAAERVATTSSDRFVCPHSNCRTFALHRWYAARCSPLVHGLKYPQAVLERLVVQDTKLSGIPAVENRPLAITTSDVSEQIYSSPLSNCYVSVCDACHQPTIWQDNKIIYPETNFAVPPHQEMPAGILADYEEASRIVQASPRGACALLRLCVQKLCIDLGCEGKNINDDIGALVAKGLRGEIQQALDVVRVTGNNAVHPLTMDLKDDIETALIMFKLLNMIVESQITEPENVRKLFDNLSPGVKAKIEQRDKAKPT